MPTLGYGLSEVTAVSHHCSEEHSKPGSIGSVARNMISKVIKIVYLASCMICYERISTMVDV